MKVKYCKVIAEYRSPFPDPLKIQKNEQVQIVEKESEWPGWIWCINKNGMEGWIPKSYLNIKGRNAILLRDYDATEINAIVGEEFIIEEEESGWFWVSSKEGIKGWIPIRNVEVFIK
ncbi:MAG: SH3 domain-containing protein [Candidatus Hermodarchaeota archaeon]